LRKLLSKHKGDIMNLLKCILLRTYAKFCRFVTYRNLKVPIHGSHVIRPIKDQLLLKQYEVPEIEALFKILRPEDRMIEIGVGLGVVSGLAAKAYPNVKIRCYEANPNLIDSIRELHEINNIHSIDLHNAICVQGQGGTKRDFHIHKSFAEGSLIVTEGTLRSVQVCTVSIEETLSNFKPNVLLIDIEGGEAELLAQLDLSEVRALVLEMHLGIISRAEEIQIYQACANAGLYPRTDLSSSNVIAFECVTQ